VIGAGVIGCAIAYELSRRGATVTVVDDRPPCMGATQASAGVLAPFIEAREEGSLLKLTTRSLTLFDHFVSRVTADSGSAIAYQRTGTLDVALEHDRFVDRQRAHVRFTEQGVESRLLDAAAVRACEPHLSNGAVGGLLIPAHGFVGAASLTGALVAAASKHGAAFLTSERIARVQRVGEGLRLVTASNTEASCRADVAILAAGSWAGTMQIGDAAGRLPVRPIRGQLLQLRWPDQIPVRRVLWSDRCYVVPWPDGTILVGATEEDAGFEEHTTLAGIQDLIDAVCELLSTAWKSGLVAAKVGLRPGTPDHLPIIGWSRAVPGLMYAAGHYRNGILLAPLTAELVAHAVLDGRTDPLLELTRPERFGEL
jgi:glycine oxidase